MLLEKIIIQKLFNCKVYVRILYDLLSRMVLKDVSIDVTLGNDGVMYLKE